MKALSGLDGTFLHLETPETPMHVGSLHLFDLTPAYKHDFYTEIRLARFRHCCRPQGRTRRAQAGAGAAGGIRRVEVAHVAGLRGFKEAQTSIASGDRRKLLAKITAPTLVIHGADDPLVPVAAGRDTAKHIKGAQLVVIDGMGHDLPMGLLPRLVDAIAAHCDRVQSR